MKLFLCIIFFFAMLPTKAIGLKDAYWCGSKELFTLGTAKVSSPGKTSFTNLRFGLIELGIQRHYNFSNKIGAFAALAIKNVGIADRDANTRYRYNGYYIGPSVGIKLGNFQNKKQILFGGGVDFAINSKFKQWEIGRKKNTKIRETLFENNNLNKINPYLFFGLQAKRLGFKVSYYLSNYFASTANLSNTNLINISILRGVGKAKQTITNKINRRGRLNKN